MGDLGRTTEPLLTITPIASAKVGGKKTNRVKVRKAPRSRNNARERISPRNPKRHELRGRSYTLISLSVYTEQLEIIDAAAERAQVSRSEFMRKAALHFAAFVTSEGGTCTIASGGCEAVSRG